jgi:hypothetical protein
MQLWAALLLTACTSSEGKFGFTLLDAHARKSGEYMQVRLEQKISLSSEAREALVHGVPLRIKVSANLRSSSGRSDNSKATRHFEIRYMPLSDHYQLSSEEAGTVHTYPRLRHALAAISAVELSMSVTGLEPGAYELRARSVLEKQYLPAPMRLPAWFSPNWQHDSGWKSWPVQIESSS